jgi:hypothetical protein
VAREKSPGRLEVVKAGRELLDVIAALDHASRFAGGLDRRQQQCDERADDGDHDQEFDKGERGGVQADGVKAIHLTGLAAAEAGVFELAFHGWNIPSSRGVDGFPRFPLYARVGPTLPFARFVGNLLSIVPAADNLEKRGAPVADRHAVACLGDAVTMAGNVERASISLAYGANWRRM